MPLSGKRIVLTALGVLAGLASWPLTELVLMGQAGFPSYLVFSMITGAVFGIILGAFFASAEGIFAKIWPRIGAGAATGAGVGVVGGVLGMLVGQGLLFIMGEYLFTSAVNFELVGLPLSRAGGWAILGLFVGMSEGIRAGAFRKVWTGALGGFVGGLVGGAALEYSRLLIPQVQYGRLVGLVLFGLLLGVAYALVERSLSYGVLRVLNGLDKGREFIINQRRMFIGATDGNDIVLKAYRNIADRHVRVRVKKGDVFLEPVETPEGGTSKIEVNDDPVTSHALKYEDVIKVGTAKLFFKHE